MIAGNLMLWNVIYTKFGLIYEWPDEGLIVRLVQNFLMLLLSTQDPKSEFKMAAFDVFNPSVPL